jgi:glycosyltransferase involved in cell wall biosynthesis
MGAPRKILLVTNLFPPQEFGGYGRMMWEFAAGLLARGHEVQVLTADWPAAAKMPTVEERAMEARVSRGLELYGEWRRGRPVLAPRGLAAVRVRRNLACLESALHIGTPDLVLAGNLDFLGQGIVETALAAEIPVLHAVANATPGYGPAVQPCSSRYWVAPCSDWNGAALRQAGYLPARLETLYPGARVDRFPPSGSPDNTSLRICYTSLVMPHKGAQILVQALVELHRRGIAFTAEIAGEAPDPAFLADLRALIRDADLDAMIRFHGFLDRAQIAALYARSNVLVFPSQFPEPFGISQVEGLAAGLAVVTSGTGGAKEVVRPGVDGLHFEPASPMDLADKLASLAQEPEVIARLQRDGQIRAAEFSVAQAAAQIEARMESLIALPPNTPTLAYADADCG